MTTAMYKWTDSYYGESCLYNCYDSLVKEKKIQRVPYHVHPLMNHSYIYENPNLLICRDVCVLTAYSNIYTGVFMMIIAVVSTMTYCALQRSILLAVVLLSTLFTALYILLHSYLKF